MADCRTFGRIAYEAYCESVGGLSIRGEPLPTYDQQNQKIIDAWQCAGQRVAATAVKALMHGLMDAAERDFLAGKNSEGSNGS
jgi:hypothetical protein